MSATRSLQHVACGRCPACVDEPAWEVAALVARGMDQVQASRLVYAGQPPEPPDPPAWDAPAPEHSAWVRQTVTALLWPLVRVVTR